MRVGRRSCTRTVCNIRETETDVEAKNPGKLRMSTTLDSERCPARRQALLNSIPLVSMHQS